ncbi:acyl-CoA N-acyltransferase [Aspergillus campestris IBT 28561]|uniref:Acyl-CoA N-acyltransferase n=1 Tax=Aspergillus campestris (strain IBT 28561) TaxID=1392248 RepID=A0A2I1D469_ASPC2|nr:acyl-CoA N-acyltransferase [Aspergillus campestris IBT 28561]PKY04665.1 acyl-CoA N-acyltransferase [Aspergillus campestris IBT 28561]
MQPPPETTLALAQPNDIPFIEAMVCAAYTKYIPRIGKPPGPMTADYHQLLETQEVWVLRLGNTILGSIVLNSAPDHNALSINNLVVDPAAQGKGYGRVLMAQAEAVARERGCTALKLFTNVHMFENVGMYTRMGFTELERRLDGGYERVFFQRELV